MSLRETYFCNSGLKIDTPTPCAVSSHDVSLLVSLRVGAFPFSTSPWQRATSHSAISRVTLLAHSRLLPRRRVH